METNEAQDGKLYNKWRAYGQGKTANILMATSLADKLGKKGLTAVSLHPGVIGTTGLGDHVDWNIGFADMRKSPWMGIHITLLTIRRIRERGQGSW